MNSRTLLGTMLSAAALSALAAAPSSAQPVPQQAAAYEPSFLRLRDTLYVLDSSYIEVRLDQQMIYQRFRSGRVEKYPCSTGDPRIKDGIATREGIFAVQGKAKKAMSQQFKVYLNYWMQFDGGIGFHGLDGRSYYRFLGRRPSSHGCVRISNETGTQLFKSTPNGTIVYVHAGKPARVLLFADSSLPRLKVMNEIDAPLLERRLKAVIDGRWSDSSLAQRIAIRPRHRFTSKIGVGRVDPLLTIQRRIELLDLPKRIDATPEPLAPVQALPTLQRGPDGEYLSDVRGD